MGYFNGQLRKWRRILPLQLLGHKRMRQDCASGHICSRVPANRGGADVWYFPVTKEDEAHQDYQDVVQEVEHFFLFMPRDGIVRESGGYFLHV